MADYPGVYKRRSCYMNLFEFLRLNVQLDYLLGKGTGLLRYRTSQSYTKKVEWFNVNFAVLNKLFVFK